MNCVWDAHVYAMNMCIVRKRMAVVKYEELNSHIYLCTFACVCALSVRLPTIIFPFSPACLHSFMYSLCSCFSLSLSLSFYISNGILIFLKKTFSFISYIFILHFICTNYKCHEHAEPHTHTYFKIHLKGKKHTKTQTHRHICSCAKNIHFTAW